MVTGDAWALSPATVFVKVTMMFKYLIVTLTSTQTDLSQNSSRFTSLCARMSLSCNFSETDYNCSALFEGVDVSVTVLQACFTAITIVVSVPINILMIVAMITYHHLLDKTFVISISFLVSNTIVAVFYSGQVFITSISRAWLFGYWSCQLFAFVTIIGRVSRWLAVGLFSVNQFRKVFFPFSRPAKVLAAILISSWVISIIVALVHFFGNATGFDISHPGCSVSSDPSSLNQAYVGALIVLRICLITAGAILPFILYIAIYLKARSLRRVQPITEAPKNQPETADTRRSKRVNVTYCLLLLNYLLYNAVSCIKAIMAVVIMKISVSRTLSVGLFFLATNVFQSYLITDVLILMINNAERKVLWKLLHKIHQLLSCGKKMF